jgi:hypothetical protein
VTPFARFGCDFDSELCVPAFYLGTTSKTGHRLDLSLKATPGNAELIDGNGRGLSGVCQQPIADRQELACNLISDGDECESG